MFRFPEGSSHCNRFSMHPHRVGSEDVGAATALIVKEHHHEQHPAVKPPSVIPMPGTSA